MCMCQEGYFGEACEYRCYNGTVANVDYYLGEYGECVCDSECINGVFCQEECSGHGQCNATGHCLCDYDEGFKGSQCNVPGCPGLTNCMGKGTCNSALGTCTCFPGYLGECDNCV